MANLLRARGYFWNNDTKNVAGISQTFNLYAAPFDLGLDGKGNGKKKVLKYKNAVKEMAKVDLLGHSGAKYANEKELNKALDDGSYRGEWFIPTREMNGTDLDDNKVQKDNLYKHRDKGAFKGTFRTNASDFGRAHWYWSCTEHRDEASAVYIVDFTDGQGGWVRKDYDSMSSRLVRAELRP